MLYVVKKDCELGERLSKYFARRKEVLIAAKELRDSLEHDWELFPLDEDTEFITPDDVDEGGLWAIVVTPERYAEVKDQYNHIMWEAQEKEEDGKRFVCLFPRMQYEPHYIRYEKALALVKSDNPRWEFRMDGDSLRVYLYKDIENVCPDNDKRQIKPKNKLSTPPDTKCALGRYYFMKESGGISVPAPKLKVFDKSVQLLRAFHNLPVIPLGTLARILGLRTRNEKASRKEIAESAQLDWQICEDCFLFRTPLVSDNKDFVPYTD